MNLPSDSVMVCRFCKVSDSIASSTTIPATLSVVPSSLLDILPSTEAVVCAVAVKQHSKRNRYVSTSRITWVNYLPKIRKNSMEFFANGVKRQKGGVKRPRQRV